MNRVLTIISAKNDLSYYTNAANFPDQGFIKQVIWYFEKTDASDVFKPLEILNILEKQCQFVKDNIKNGNAVISHLQALPLNKREKHIVLGIILKWFGGYPVNHPDKDFDKTLKLIETEFLATHGCTDEKHFCISKKEKQRRFMRVGLEVYTKLMYGVDANLAPKSSDIKESKIRTFGTFDELFEAAVREGKLVKSETPEDFIILRTRCKFQFNEWLLEIKDWDCREDDNYRKWLTLETWKEFLQSQPEIEKDLLDGDNQKMIMHQVGNEDDTATFDDLFYDTKLINPCIKVLREIDTCSVSEDLKTLIGPAGIAVIWMRELKNRDFIKPRSFKKYAELLRGKFKGFQ